MIAFVGVGQIGGSLLLRLREVAPELEVVAYDRATLPGVRQMASLEDAVRDAEIVVVGLPLDATLAELPRILTATTGLVIDLMSVKLAVHVAAGDNERFVGGHPMFGSEGSGFEAANPAWVVDAPFVLTASSATASVFKERAERFVRLLGCRPIWREAQAHDQEVARVSHVPQMVASALALLAERRSWELQGPAFRDMTRIAASPPEMWAPILKQNSHIEDVLNELQELLHRPSLLADAKKAKDGAPVPHTGVLADRVAESSTGAMLARVMELKAKGRPIAGLHVGEPQLDASPEVLEVARAAMSSAPIHYTQTAGTTTLRERVASVARAVTGRAYAIDDIIVTVGAKQALHLALASLIAPGEEVLVPVPAWVSFIELVKLCGGRPVPVPDLTRVREHITPRTRAIILNTPNNPTGAVYSRALLEDVLAACRDLWVVSDELYRCFVWEGEHTSPVKLHERAIWLDGLSKSHAMTGLRIGYAAGPRDVIARMRRLASHETSAAPSVSQAAAVALLDRWPNGDPALIAEVRARRLQVLDKLGGEMAGAFYAWTKARPGQARRLLDEHDVAVMPGDAFGSPGMMRIAYATDASTLQRALSAIAAT